MKEKTFEGYLMLNWKTNKVRVTKKKTKDLNPYEIRVPYTIKVRLPEVKDTPLNVDISLPVVDTSDIKM